MDIAHAEDSATGGIGHHQRGERESASVEKTGENSTCKKIKHYA
jgi:hypothetical protein